MACDARKVESTAMMLMNETKQDVDFFHRKKAENV